MELQLCSRISSVSCDGLLAKRRLCVLEMKLMIDKTWLWPLIHCFCYFLYSSYFWHWRGDLLSKKISHLLSLLLWFFFLHYWQTSVNSVKVLNTPYIVCCGFPEKQINCCENNLSVKQQLLLKSLNGKSPTAPLSCLYVFVVWECNPLCQHCYAPTDPVNTEAVVKGHDAAAGGREKIQARMYACVCVHRKLIDQTAVKTFTCSFEWAIKHVCITETYVYFLVKLC